MKDSNMKIFKLVLGYAVRAIQDADKQGERSAILHTMNPPTKNALEITGVTVTEEIEDDNIYYIISWE